MLNVIKNYFNCQADYGYKAHGAQQLFIPNRGLNGQEIWRETPLLLSHSLDEGPKHHPTLHLDPPVPWIHVEALQPNV